MRSFQNSILDNTKKLLLALVVLGLIFVAAYAVTTQNLGDRHIFAGTPDNLSGWAWGSNIGWISFNCTDLGTCGTANYGVFINSTSGILSGYAWSPNIGWITFNENELGGCPSSQCRAKLSGNNLTGWARAKAGGTGESGGWDGWISLDKKSGSINYGPVLSQGTVFQGYAWGGDVVGWIDFAPQYGGVLVSELLPATAFLSANPTSVFTGESSTLSWTSENATTCSGTNFGTSGATSGGASVSPAATTLYTITCSNAISEATANAQVAVLSPACSDSIDNDNDGKIDYPADPGCSGSGDQSEGTPFTGTVSITALPDVVNSGAVATVTWSSTETSSCAVTGTNGDSWTGTSGSRTTSPIIEETTYTLSCTDSEGDAVSPVGAIVGLHPQYEEF